MVSIPDWSRFRRGPPPASPIANRSALTPRERYIRAMEREAIQEASRKGYFLEPSKDSIIDSFGDTHGAEDAITGLPMQKQMKHVNHIRYTNQHMKMIGDIHLFTRITILILDHNYLESIDELMTCRELVKLDVHSNQLSVMPDVHFWANMGKLRILLAHDNPIGRIEAIHSLVTCPRLNILTLYDTPLSLKKNYRHHVVNTIWTLRALDFHVISDEEIIEDAVFKNTRFTSMSRKFEVDLTQPAPKPGSTFKQELHSVRMIVASVNKIMAHYCPVLIIQKNIRFWLTYRRYSLYVESRLWAAITIQRAWRTYKGLHYLPDQPLDKMSTLMFSEQSSRKLATLPDHSNRMGEVLGTPSRRNRYPQNRLKNNNVSIDMHKLFKVSTEREDSLNEHRILAKAHKMAPKKVAGKVPNTRTIPDPPSKPGRKPFIHQSAFFGKVVKSGDLQGNHSACQPATLPGTTELYTHVPYPQPQTGYKTIVDTAELYGTAEETVPVVGYRLKGRREPLAEFRGYEENIITHKEVGQDIRDLETHLHDKVAVINEPKERVKRDADLKNKFMFERIQQTMALSCLTAVQQAYRDRELDERKLKSIQEIMSIKERKEAAKERVRLFHQEKRLMAQANRHDDKKMLIDILEDRDKKELTDLEKSLNKRSQERSHKEQRKDELRFSREFRTQQTSVSKALLRHDRQIRRDTTLQNKIEKLEGLKDMEREQHEIVTKYMQHRQMLRQTENSMARAALDTKMLQDANDRVYEAKTRVEQKKLRQDKVEQYVPVPVTRGADQIPEIPRPANNFTRITEDISNRRKTHSKSMFQFYVPRSNSYARPETRLTMSGGISRIAPSESITL